MGLFTLHAEPLKRKTDTTCPPDAKTVSFVTKQAMNWQHETYQGHKGWDLATNLEAWNVYAQDSGVVSEVFNNTDARGYGVTIRSTTGETRYMHFNSFPTVSGGKTVNKGDLIGYSGGSGYGSLNYYAVHLHIDVYDFIHGYVDPLPYILGDNSLNGAVKKVPEGNAYNIGDDVLIDRNKLGKVTAIAYDENQKLWVARVERKGNSDVYHQFRLCKVGQRFMLDGENEAYIREIAEDKNGRGVAKIETIIFADRLR